MPTINPMLGEASVEIGGETLTLVINNTALLALEELTDRSFLDVVAEIIAAQEAKRLQKVGTMQALVWAALRAHHDEVSTEQAGALVLRHRAALMTAVFDALNAALPKEDADAGEAKPPKAKNRGPAKAGTGTTSSAAG